MKKILTLFVMLGIAITLNAQTQPTDTDGDGWYNISTLDHLRWVSENDSSWAWNFELDNDIDAGDTKNWNNGKGFSPIGKDYYKPFSGTFDGNRNIIMDLYINRPNQDFIGLFGYIEKVKSEITNLGLECNIYGNNEVGALVGKLDDGIINNCFSKGNINGNRNIGGLIGEMTDATIRDCYSSCSIIGNNTVSGLVAKVWGGSILDCYSKCDIEGNSTVGGLIGESYEGLIYNNYSVSSIFANNKVGGLIGSSSKGTISNCFANVDIEGNEKLGGLIGYISDGVIKNCYGIGKIYGKEYIGGLIGDIWSSTVRNCYSTTELNGNKSIGGLIGYEYSSNTTNSFWDTQTSKQSSSAGGMGKSTAEMKTKSTFTDAEWDFTEIWNINSETNEGYPFIEIRPVGILENLTKETNNLLVYPNPIVQGNILSVSIEKTLTDYSIEIYNINGEKVTALLSPTIFSGNNIINIPIHNLESGVYILVLQTDGESVNKKFVISK